MENNRDFGGTTLKEAKLLVEAGLDPNTADMRYEENNYELLDEWVAYPFGGDIKDFEVLKKEFPDSEFYPCWSLGALIGLMPKYIPHKRNKEEGKEHWCYSLLITPNTIYYGCHIINNLNYLYDDLINFKYDNCIAEAAVNAVCWLIKNCYIKKHE